MAEKVKKINNKELKKTTEKEADSVKVSKKETKITKKARKNRPQRGLTKKITKKAGRNSRGKITVRHRGGGAKRLYRIVDFKREIMDIPAEVLAIEYDPNRSSYIALVQYGGEGGEKRYIIAPHELNKGDVIVNTEKKARFNVGDRMLLKNISPGTVVHDVEIIPGRGGQLVRAAGAGASILSRDAGYTHLKMPSGEIRMIKDECRATVGQVSNISHNREVIGKAGRKRHMGIRPTVRGKAMNPVDHPHGGGEGRQPIGLKHPKTPWGAPALGYRTRKKKSSDKLIIRRRKSRT